MSAAAVLIALAALALPGRASADDFDCGRRLFLEKADCTYCHGWAGDGTGSGQSPGGAANLRQSKLGRDQLITVIRCGIPGTAMPHFDDDAYSDTRCNGMTAAEPGDKVPTLPPGSTLAEREFAVVADYLLAKIVGRGPITREECLEMFGTRARSCNDYPPKP